MIFDESLPTNKSLFLWRKGQSSPSLSNFLSAFPPSKTYKRLGGDGWIWVTNKECPFNNSVTESILQSLKQAQVTFSNLNDQLQAIRNDNSAPLTSDDISNPDKLTLQEEAIRKCEENLQRIGSKDWPCGKWLFFERPESVDNVFSCLSRSIIDGPLSKLRNSVCFTVKVSSADNIHTNTATSSGNTQHVISLFFENIWHKESATEVLECLIKEHGQIPNSAKPLLYTMIGLNSMHHSNMRATLYRPNELFEWQQLQEWRSAFLKNSMNNEGTILVNTELIKRPSGTMGTDEDEESRSSNKKSRLEKHSGERARLTCDDLWAEILSETTAKVTSKSSEICLVNETAVEDHTTSLKPPSTAGKEINEKEKEVEP